VTPAVKIPAFAQLGTGEAETLLRRWAASNPLRWLFGKAAWGRNPRVAQTSNQVAYRIRLLSQYESRSLRYDEVRIRREPISSETEIGDLWAYPVEKPTEFVNRTDTYPIPGTDQLVGCRACNGLGLTRCSRCSGTGRVRDSDADLQLAIWNCPACSGDGMSRCETCRGYGQMRRFAVLVVRFETRDTSLVADNSRVPSERLRLTPGEQFFALREPGRVQIPEVVEPVKEGLRLLQERSQPRFDQVLLFQEAQAEAIPIVRARIDAPGGKGEFWIYGKDRRLFLPPEQRLARIDWLRVGLLIGVLLAAGAAAAFLSLFP